MVKAMRRRIEVRRVPGMLLFLLAMRGLPIPAMAQVNWEVPLSSPAERAAWAELTTPEGVLGFYEELAARSPHVRVREVGRSAEERPILAVTLARPAVAEPWEAQRTGKPIVFVGAQVHGDEPGSKEGMMLFARDLALGPLQQLLDRVVFVLVPQINPDGAAAGQSGTRANAGRMNVNRDYMRLETPETRAVVGVVTAWRPHVIVDAHELDGPPRVYDFYTFSAVNVNGPHPPERYAADQVVPAVVAALEAAGYTHQVYHRVSNDLSELDEGIFAGGYGAQSLSRYGGTQGAISILFESRTERGPRGGIQPRPNLEDRARRQYIAMEALARFVAERPAEVVGAVEAGRHQMTQLGAHWEPSDSIAIRIDHVASRTIPYRFGEMRRARDEAGSSWWEPTGRVLDVRVPLVDSTVTTLARVRPVGYLIAPHRRDLADHLMEHGIQVERLVSGAAVEVERFRVDSVATEPTPYEGYIPQVVWTTIELATLQVPGGAFLVRAGQPNAALLFHLLEPEDLNSYASVGRLVAETRRGQPLPIYRLRRIPAAPTYLLQ
jgi:dipeptidyl-peptidase 4